MTQNTSYRIQWNEGEGATNWITGLARIFDWGGGKLQITCNDLIGNFRQRNFMGQRYRRMEDQKPWPSLARNKDFAKARKLKSKLENENV